ncbi:MAG: RES family NAD+ phosphorylase [Terriglobia bacterium]
MDDWRRFRYDVKNRNRYIFCQSTLRASATSSKFISSDEFLQELVSLLQSSNRFIKLKTDTILWRAQLEGTPYQPPENAWVKNDGTEIPLEGIKDFRCRAFLKPHDCQRMKPFPDKATEGRVNPKGIPCLYTATNPRTALSEMKPKIGSYLTLAEFSTGEELRIVDFACNPTQLADAEDGPTDEEMDSLIWEGIGDAFSEPVTNSDDIADYASTQIVAELFRRTGYDGIRYKSKCIGFESLEPLGSPERLKASQEVKTQDGQNIALFNPKSATFMGSRLYKFAADRSGAFDFIPVNNLVFCSDQIPERD